MTVNQEEVYSLAIDQYEKLVKQIESLKKIADTQLDFIAELEKRLPNGTNPVQLKVITQMKFEEWV